jgi:hypothetical protein
MVSEQIAGLRLARLGGPAGRVAVGVGRAAIEFYTEEVTVYRDV